jgi:hypothetical protein
MPRKSRPVGMNGFEKTGRRSSYSVSRRSAHVGRCGAQTLFGSELWFGETIGGTPLTDWWSDPPDSYERLFTHGTRAKALIAGILGRFTPEDWSRAVELKSPQVTLKVTARKALANALMHEIRHWA